MLPPGQALPSGQALHPGAPAIPGAALASKLPLIAGAALLAGALLLAGCGSGHTATPLGNGTSTTAAGLGAGSTTSTPPSTTAGGRANAATAGGPDAPPAVPAHGAYLGAWLHPTPAAAGQSAFAVQQASIGTVLAATGRPLGLLHVYARWGRPAPVSQLRAVVGDGSVPILDWGCGSDVTSLASGVDDSAITAYAEALKGFGGPVFLRWCWEMNLVGLHPHVGGPAGFVSAWDHIRTLFRNAGASNVSFVWCPGLRGADPAPYFPGASEVDWIGVDVYSRTASQTFGSLFGAFVRAWQGEGKPLMVAETGAAGANQPAYIDSIGADAPALPAVKAVVYFDAPGPANAWQFTPAGLQAFGRLAAAPYFRPA